MSFKKTRGRPRKTAAQEVKQVSPAPKAKISEPVWTAGKRKTAVARIRLIRGKGFLTINEKPYEEYFPHPLEQQRILVPFKAAGRNPLGYDVTIKVAGSGRVSQLSACVHAIAKALVKHEPNLRSLLKRRSLLTRDPRMKERKKYGLRRARKAPQYSKR